MQEIGGFTEADLVFFMRLERGIENVGGGKIRKAPNTLLPQHEKEICKG